MVTEWSTVTLKSKRSYDMKLVERKPEMEKICVLKRMFERENIRRKSEDEILMWPEIVMACQDPKVGTDSALTTPSLNPSHIRGDLSSTWVIKHVNWGDQLSAYLQDIV